MEMNRAADVAELLMAARSIADLACADGVHATGGTGRVQANHLGAVLADAVLQAGLNYTTVVRPRVERIIREYPQASDMRELVKIITMESVPRFLNWTHPTKATRFVKLVTCLNDHNVSEVRCLRTKLADRTFREKLRSIDGVGPKTIDYMACLVGIDSIAVDRHVRSFAKRAGVLNEEYEYLKVAFCYAADLLAVSRREFDAWIWRSHARSIDRQSTFSF